MFSGSFPSSSWIIGTTWSWFNRSFFPLNSTVIWPLLLCFCKIIPVALNSGISIANPSFSSIVGIESVIFIFSFSEFFCFWICLVLFSLFLRWTTARNFLSSFCRACLIVWSSACWDFIWWINFSISLRVSNISW